MLPITDAPDTAREGFLACCTGLRATGAGGGAGAGGGGGGGGGVYLGAEPIIN